MTDINNDMTWTHSTASQDTLDQALDATIAALRHMDDDTEGFASWFAGDVYEIIETLQLAGAVLPDADREQPDPARGLEEKPGAAAGACLHAASAAMERVEVADRSPSLLVAYGLINQLIERFQTLRGPLA